MKLLVIQLSGASDLLLSTLLLRCLKKSLPEAELHVLVQQQHAVLVANNPYIDQLHQLHFNRETTLHQLLPQHFDYVMDLQPSAQSAPFVAQLQPTKKGENQQKGLKAFLTQLFNRPNVAPHKAERYLQMANALNVTNDGGGLDFFIPKNDVVPFGDIPASHHAGFIALAISQTEAYQWPLALLQQLCTGIQHPVVLLGTERDVTLAEKVSVIDRTKIYNACGKFSLFETADLLKKSKLLIAVQPYFIQVGAALNTEQIMVAATPKEDLPYYWPSFAKSKETAPFDTVAVPKALYGKGGINPTDPKLESLNQKLALQIVEKTTRRVRGKV